MKTTKDSLEELDEAVEQLRAAVIEEMDGVYTWLLNRKPIQIALMLLVAIGSLLWMGNYWEAQDREKVQVVLGGRNE